MLLIFVLIFLLKYHFHYTLIFIIKLYVILFATCKIYDSYEIRDFHLEEKTRRFNLEHDLKYRCYTYLQYSENTKMTLDLNSEVSLDKTKWKDLSSNEKAL